MLLAGVARVVGVLAERQDPVDRTLDASGIETVQVEVPNSELEIVGADVDDVTITGTVTSGIRRTDLRAERSDGRIVVAMDCGRLASFHDCSADVRLEVPHGLAVSVDSSNTELTLRDLTGPVDAATTNSPMRAAGLAGPVRLRATNSSVEATGLRAATVDVSTSNDHVLVEFLEAPESVVVRSTNARAAVVVPDTPDFYALQLSTTNAGTSAEVRSDPDSDRSLRVTTSNDDLVVRYPD